MTGNSILIRFTKKDRLVIYLRDIFTHYITSLKTGTTSNMSNMSQPSHTDTVVDNVYTNLEHLLSTQSPQQESPDSVLITLGTPFVSLAILDNGHITTHVLGSPLPSLKFASNGIKPPLDHNTLFQACSISKPLTSMVIHKLCQDGVLSLSASISTYLSPEQISWISTPQTYDLAANITLSQLLSHTSGLSCTGFAGYPSLPHPSLEQILRSLPPANNVPVTVAYMPGSKYVYSGGGYAVVQLVLETMLHKPFPKIMQAMLLSPLNMDRSTYHLLDKDEQNYACANLTGQVTCAVDYHDLPESAAAGLWTTPRDLLRAVHAVQTSLAFPSDGRCLQKEWARTMLTEVEDNKMALGWVAGRNGNNISHTGGNEPGYRCIVAGYADLSFARTQNNPAVETDLDAKKRPEDSGVCIMTSSAVGEVVFGKLLLALAYLKGWPILTGIGNIVPFIDRAKSVDPRAKEWIGKWNDGKWEIGCQDGSEIFWVGFGGTTRIALVRAAVPSCSYDEGESVDLVAEGLKLMLRLGWKEGVKTVEVWQGSDVLVLKRDEE